MSSDNEQVEYDVHGDAIYHNKPQNDTDSEGEESDPLATSGEDAAEKKEREEVFGAAIDDLIAERRQYRRRGRKRKLGQPTVQKRARHTDVPRQLNSVMGAATLAFVAKNFEEAIELLQRVIKEAPSAVAPRRTLGLIHEEQGDRKKALEFYMSAAQLNRQDRELWKRNSALWEDEGDYEKAIYCLTQALRGSHSKDVEALRGRGLLLMKLGKHGKAAENFSRVVKLVPDDIELAHLITQLYRKSKSPGKASKVLEGMVRDLEVAVERKSSGRESKLKSILALLEILIALRFVENRYLDAAALLSRMKDLNAELGCALTFVQRLLEAICHHRLVSTTVAEPTFREFMSSPSIVSKHPILLKQVADACREGSNFADGVRAYTMLLEMENLAESPVELRLHRSVCYMGIGDMTSAKSDLEYVLMVHPRHVEASLRYQQFQSTKEVAKTKHNTTKKHSSLVAQYSLSAKERKEAVDALTYGKKLFDSGDTDGFLAQVFLPLESALFLSESDPRENSNHYSGEENMHKHEDDEIVPSTTEEAGIGPALNATHSMAHVTTIGMDKERLQGLGAVMMRILLDDQLVEVAEMVVFSFQARNDVRKASSLVRIFDSLAHLRISGGRMDLKRRLRVLDTITSTAIGDLARAHDTARWLLLDKPKSADEAFAYSVVDQMWKFESDTQRNRSFQFLKRLKRKNPSLYLAFVAGNCSSRGGINIRRYTVGIYLHALKMCPNHPLICLVLAIQTLYVAAGRRIQNRNEMITYALAFLNDYTRNRKAGAPAEVRGLYEMETDYNLGRAMHQLGLLHYATEAYKRVLTKEYEGVEQGKVPEWADLRRDAAYNLIQIYRGSGSLEMAAAICEEYLVF
ncbi:Transcription factor [Gracilaria domingensis]|nr:Transcription factor [Gracilaria domingensis]